MWQHREDCDREGKRQANPELLTNTANLRVIFRGDRHQGFETHATDRTGARSDLADLRMHRAGVDRALADRRWLVFLRGRGHVPSMSLRRITLRSVSTAGT